MRRLIFPLLLGIVGCAILIALGTWQLQRLEWKESVLDTIQSRIAAPPEALPEAPAFEADRYRAVVATGTLSGNGVLVFAPVEGLGIGYRAIAAFYAGDRAILVDLGFTDDPELTFPMAEEVTVTGNLAWPDELTGSTPPPDPNTGIRYARDVPEISELLGTEPLMIVAREIAGVDPGTVPVPVSTAGIKNDHLNYAITWFLLAVVWAAMTGYLIWRIRRAG